MRSIARSAWSVVGLLLAAGVATAQDRSKGNEGPAGRSPSGPAAAAAEDVTRTDATAPAKECAHQMTGTVKDLDKARGTLEIQIVGEEPLRIHLPASELSGFDEGDEVVVSMGVKEREEAAAPVR